MAALRHLLLAAAVLQRCGADDKRFVRPGQDEATQDEAFWAREHARDAAYLAKQQAHQRPQGPQATALGSVQTFRLGCVKPEPDEAPKPVKGADACAATCVDESAPRRQLQAAAPPLAEVQDA